MKILIIRKKGKTVYKFQAADGLIFERKEHCIFYESKWMKK